MSMLFHAGGFVLWIGICSCHQGRGRRSRALLSRPLGRLPPRAILRWNAVNNKFIHAVKITLIINHSKIPTFWLGWLTSTVERELQLFGLERMANQSWAPQRQGKLSRTSSCFLRSNCICCNYDHASWGLGRRVWLSISSRCHLPHNIAWQALKTGPKLQSVTELQLVFSDMRIPLGISSKECDNPGCRKKRFFFCKNRWLVHVANPDSPFFARASLASIL